MLVSCISSGGNEHSWFKSYVESAIKFLLAENEVFSVSGSKGGYLSIFKPHVSGFPPKMEYLIPCGKIPLEKKERYLYLSIEKALRLNKKMSLEGHKTSRESENEENQEYAGSVFFKDEERIFSFSGFEPEWDEFIAVYASCFNAVLSRRNYPERTTLEDVPALFKKRAEIVCATERQLERMIIAVKTVVFLERKI